MSAPWPLLCAAAVLKVDRMTILYGYGWGVTQTYTCTNYEERVATNNILHPLDII